MAEEDSAVVAVAATREVVGEAGIRLVVVDTGVDIVVVVAEATRLTDWRGLT